MRKVKQIFVRCLIIQVFLLNMVLNFDSTSVLLEHSFEYFATIVFGVLQPSYDSITAMLYGVKSQNKRLGMYQAWMTLVLSESLFQ